MKHNTILRRRMLSLLLVAAMLLCNVTAALADTTACITLSSSSVTQGNSVDLYLGIENASAISAMDVYLRYDSDNLRFSSGEKYSLGSQPNVMLMCSEVEPGLIHLMLVHPGTDGLSGTGSIARITFSTGADSECGTYPVEVIVNDVLNTANQPLAMTGRNGSIQVTELTAGTICLYSRLSAGTVNVGDEVQFSVYAYDLYDLVCGKFVFFYDDAVLELQEPVQCGAVFKNCYCDLNQTNPGVLSASLISGSAIRSSDWEKTLFTLTFAAKKAGSVRISCSAEQLENDALQSLNSVPCSAQLTVVQPVTPVVNPALRLALSKDAICEEDQFDVTLTITEGSGLAALDVIVDYDDSVLQCGSCTVMETGTGQLTEVNGQKSGQVELSYIGTALTGETLLLTMHMTALSSSLSEQVLGLNVRAAATSDFHALTLDAAPLIFPVNIPAVHGKWTYSAEGAVITATCGHTNCGHTETATLTVPETGCSYDGEEKKPASIVYTPGFPDQTLTVSYADNVSAGTAHASVAYAGVSASAAFPIGKAAQSIAAEAVQSVIYGDTGKTVTAAAAYENAVLHYAVKSGDSVSVAADTGALTIRKTGDTVIAVTADETANYLRASREVTVSVGRKAIAKPTENTAAFTYTGEPQTYVPAGFDAETMSVTGSEQTNAGTYTVTVTPKENYVWSTDGACTFAWTIGRAAYEMSGAAFENASTVYDGAAHHPVVTGTLPVGADGIQVTVFYSAGQTDVGSTEVTAAFATESGNYHAPAAMTATQTVTAAEITNDAVTQTGTLIYTGEAQTAAVSASAATVNAQAAEFSYCAAENGEYGADVPAFTDAGAHTVYYRVTAPNHNEKRGSFTVCIGKAKAEITVDQTAIEKTYGETVTIPTASADFGTVFCDKAPEDLVNAGTYAITYTVADTDNYDGDSKTVSVTVNKAAQSITAEAVQNVIYGDTGKMVTAAAAYENAALHYAVKSGDSVSVAADTGALTIRKTGDTVITVTADETANYLRTSREVTVSVGRKAIAKPTENTAAFTYTGEPQTYVPAGFDAETMTISGNTHTDANETGYTVSVEPKEYYAWSDGGDCAFTWVIHKADAPEAYKNISGEIAAVTGNTAAIRLNAPDENAAFQIQGITGVQEISGKIENRDLILTVDSPVMPGASGFTVNVAVSQCGNYRDYTAAVSVTLRPQRIELGQTVPENENITLPVRLAYNIPTEVVFVTAGYDADGRMLCCAMETVLVGEETETVTLPLPGDAAADSAAIWRVMTVDPDRFCPLGQAA